MKRHITSLTLCLFGYVANAQEAKPTDQFTGLDRKAIIDKFGQPSLTKKPAAEQETLIYIFRKKEEGIGSQKGGSGKEEKMHMYSFTLGKDGKVATWNESFPASK